MTISVYRSLGGAVTFKTRVTGAENERLECAMYKIKPLLDMDLPLATIAAALQQLLPNDRVILL